jgi:hypothetical protein
LAQGEECPYERAVFQLPRSLSAPQTRRLNSPTVLAPRPVLRHAVRDVQGVDGADHAAKRISPSCTPKKRSTVHQEGQLLGEQQIGICTEAAPRTAPGG